MRRIIIVGGGLAGLACAHKLREAGEHVRIFEASDAVGGRVRTDHHRGFLLDRGFQVYLSAYPESGRILNLPALELRRFKPGALVFKGGKLRRLMDVFRCPSSALGTAMQPIGTLRDKFLVARLRSLILRRSLEEINGEADETTESFLRRFGFSEAMIDEFFRAFYGGIFLERELRTPRRMFEFTFQMFSRGHATLPARGMAEIPVQLAAKLPPGSIHLSCPVRAVESDGVILESGMLLEADAVVVATDVHTMHRLLPRLEPTERPWRASTTVYFEAPHSPLQEPIVALNGESSGLINNVCVQSDVAPSYAPEGKALVAVSLLGTPSGDDLNTRIRTEARSWFGNGVDTWEHLRTYRIKHSLPEHPPGPTTSSETGFGKHHGIYVCGDHLTSPSIDGAVRSGRLAAEAVLTSRQAVAV